MKNTILILTALLLSSFAYSQRHFRGKFETDIFGSLNYETLEGFKASLSKNIFDDIIYEDSNKNKLTYKKKFLDKLYEEDDIVLFNNLLRYFADKYELQEEFEIDIFDKLNYSNNSRFKASFSKNIFDDVVYEDSNNNKIVYKEEFLELFYSPDLASLDAFLFMDMLYTMMHQKNYQEQYEIDVFDNVKYTSSDGTSVKIDKDRALKLYKQNKKRSRTPVWRGFF